MFSLLDALLERELGLNNTKVHTALVRRFDKNFKNGHSVISSTQTSGQILSIQHQGNLVGVLADNFELSLYDISVPRKIWSMQITPLPDYRFTKDSVMVNKDGYILLKSVNNFSGHDYCHGGIYLQLFYQEKQVCAFSHPYKFYYHSIRLVDGRILGVARCSFPIYIIEWDLNGAEKAQIKIENLFEPIDYIRTALCDELLIVHPERNFWSRKKVPVLLYDIEKKQLRALDLKFRPEDEAVESKFIDTIVRMNDSLVLSYHAWNFAYSATDPQGALSPRLYLFDLHTGQIKCRPSLLSERGMVKQLIAKSNKIVLHTSNGGGNDSIVVVHVSDKGTTTETIFDIRPLPEPILRFHDDKLFVSFQSRETNSVICNLVSLDSFQVSSVKDCPSNSDFLPTLIDYHLVIPVQTGFQVNNYKHFEPFVVEPDPDEYAANTP